MLGPIVTAPVELFNIPLNTPAPVAIPNVVPVFERFPAVVNVPIRKFGFTEFPIVLFETLKTPVVPPEVFIPVTVPEFEAVPIASRAPIVLF